ncbi:MAG: adenine phosphoribosyltransferase [bacterium]
MNLQSKIREIPDWPKNGVTFYDITPLLQDPASFKCTIDKFVDFFKKEKVDKVVGIDARGFLLAAPIAYNLGVGVAIVRKKGKLPYSTLLQEYDLEYDSNILEIHTDAIMPGERVLIIDDVLATGGTAKATVLLVEQLKGQVAGLGFLMDLTFLKGKDKLKNYNILSLVDY